MMKVQLNKEIQGISRRFLQPLTHSARAVTDLVLPPRCAFSGKVVAAQGEIVPEEWAKLQFISDPQCTSCGQPFEFKMDIDMQCPSCLKDAPHYNQARAALVYDDHSRDLVLRFKHADQIHTVVAFLPWMMRAGEPLIEKADLILPVPLHRWRLLKRRYNQAALISKRLFEHTGIPWRYDTLIRNRATPTQGYMESTERKKNVRGAFDVPDIKQSHIQGKNILLIDDVFTTGATVNECTKTLLNSGAENVNVLTLARVVKK